LKNLEIEATQYTPQITLDNGGFITLVGESYPEDTIKFYAPMLSWVKKYFDTNAAELTIVNIELSYFNSSSSKLFFDFFNILDLNRDEHKIKVNWIYDEENEVAEEIGEEFILDFKDLNISLVTKSED